VIRQAFPNHQLSQFLQHLLGGYLPRYLDTQTSARLFIDDVQQSEHLAAPPDLDNCGNKDTHEK
jgi:hypothetical protein